jgi:hypothetical protein
MDIVIEGNRIAEVRSVGYPKVPIREGGRPAKGDREIDGTGMYVMPGFVDLHVHCGGGQAPEAEYVYKLWLAHGVTTARGVPFGGLTGRSLRRHELREEIRSSRRGCSRITGPFTGDGWDHGRSPRRPTTPANGSASRGREPTG